MRRGILNLGKANLLCFWALAGCWGVGLCGIFPGGALAAASFSSAAFLAASFSDSSHCFSNNECLAAASFSSWHFLYFFPEPQWQGSLRPMSVFLAGAWRGFCVSCGFRLNNPIGL